MDDASRSDQDPVDSAFRALLAAAPGASVAAIATHGLFVAVPESIELHGHPVLDARSALDLVDPSERPIVIDAWDRVRESGATRARVQLRAGGEGTLYFFDTRARHGVLLGALVADGELSTRTTPEPVSITPRVAIQRKSDIAVFVDVDDATTRMLGFSREEMIGRASLDFVHPDDHDRAVESWMDMLGSVGDKRRTRLRYRRADGSWIWLELTNQNRLGDPADPHVLTEALDVSDEMAAHEAVRVREQLLRRVAETVPLGLLHLDLHGNVLYANERLHEILGIEKVHGSTLPFTNVVPADRGLLDLTLERLMTDGTDCDLEVGVTTRRRHDDRLCHLRLRALCDPDGEVTGAIVCVEDITERARARAELEHRATFDPLTGCLNRASVLNNLDLQIAAGSPIGVIFLDLDGFKGVNDEHGHSTGDLVLIEAVRRITSCVRDSDTVGRIGGDEFLVVCADTPDLDAVMLVANRIADALTVPLALGESATAHPDSGRRAQDVIAMRASIGVALSSGAVTTSESLIAAADAAMYTSKRDGGGRPVAVAPGSR